MARSPSIYSFGLGLFAVVFSGILMQLSHIVEATTTLDSLAFAFVGCSESEATMTNSTVFLVNDHELRRTTFFCSSGNSDSRGSEAGTGILLGETLPLEVRSAAECKHPSPECQCGVSASCICTNVTMQGPNPVDCSILLDSMHTVSEVGGPSFVVQPNTIEIVSFESCAFSFNNNQRLIPLEYCWDEFAVAGGLLNQDCFAANAGTGGLCSATDNLWSITSMRIVA